MSCLEDFTYENLIHQKSLGDTCYLLGRKERDNYDKEGKEK